MYPTRRFRESPVQNIYGYTRVVEEKIPTFARTLNQYFDAHFEAIILEWQLLTDYELNDLEKRLDNVTQEIGELYGMKSEIEKRAKTVTAELEGLEEGLHEAP